jgi:hypothetical protein
MKLTFRTITDWKADYPILKEWWAGHDRCAVDQSLINAGTCYLTLLDGKPAAFACLYLGSKGGVCWLQFILTDPKLESFVSAKIIRQSLNWIDMEAKAMHYEIMFTNTNMPSLGRMYESNGFQIMEKDVTFYAKQLDLTTKEAVA